MVGFLMCKVFVFFKIEIMVGIDVVLIYLVDVMFVEELEFFIDFEVII